MVDEKRTPSAEVNRRKRGRRGGYRRTKKTNIDLQKGENDKSQKENKMDAIKSDSLDDKNSVVTSGGKSTASNKANIPEVQHDTDLSNQKNLNDIENSKATHTSVPRKGWWQRIIE